MSSEQKEEPKLLQKKRDTPTIKEIEIPIKFNIKKNIRFGPWQEDEDEILIKWVEDNGPYNWSRCAKKIKLRTGKQCREHWKNILCSTIKKGRWTSEENLLILKLYNKFNSWKKIIPLFPKRTENAIKNRFYIQLRKVALKNKNEDVSKIKLEELKKFLDEAIQNAEDIYFNENKYATKEKFEEYLKEIEDFISSYKIGNKIKKSKLRAKIFGIEEEEEEDEEEIEEEIKKKKKEKKEKKEEEEKIEIKIQDDKYSNMDSMSIDDDEEEKEKEKEVKEEKEKEEETKVKKNKPKNNTKKEKKEKQEKQEKKEKKSEKIKEKKSSFSFRKSKSIEPVNQKDLYSVSKYIPSETKLLYGQSRSNIFSSNIFDRHTSSKNINNDFETENPYLYPHRGTTNYILRPLKSQRSSLLRPTSSNYLLRQTSSRQGDINNFVPNIQQNNQLGFYPPSNDVIKLMSKKSKFKYLTSSLSFNN